MNKRDSNILFLAAGRRVELIQSFKTEAINRNMDLKIFVADSNPELAPASYFADHFFKCPLASDSNYIHFILDLCEKNNIHLVIPTIDIDLLVLSESKSFFKDHGIIVLVSDQDLVEQASDKRETKNLFDSLAIKTPEIYQLEDLKYPCFVKPYNGSNSKGAMRLDNPSQLSDSVKNNPKMIYMELIEEDFVEYTLDVYYDHCGFLKCMVPRLRLETRAGEVSKAITRKNHVYDFMLPKLIKLEGAKGCITVQLFANINDFYGIEINPRFGGGYPLSYAAGANYPGWILDEYFFSAEIDFFDQWKSDLMMLRYDSKVLVDVN